MNAERLNELAMLIDRMDNLCMAMTIPMPADLHIKALSEALPKLKNDLLLIYLDAGGEDHWNSD